MLWRFSPKRNEQDQAVEQEYMQMALDLAERGRGLVSPNPLVGAVLVKDGEIVGKGFHRYNERKHAEILALEEAGERASGASLYINLEPCSHYGRTPPCAEALVESGVARVVAAMQDPNPLVAGRGFELLRRAHIQVEVGLLEKEARRLNEKFIKFITTARPFVLLKVASSLDGRIATRARHSRWITGEQARLASQEMRYEYDAILVGIETVLKDDPELLMRLDRQKHRPLARVILDSNLRIPLQSKLVQTARRAPLLIFSGEKSSQEKKRQLEESGAAVITMPDRAGRLDIRSVLDYLGNRQITSLIVEGGAEVSAAFLEARLVDKVTFFIAPKIIGGRNAVPAIGGEGIVSLEEAIELEDVTFVRRGRDIEVTGYPLWREFRQKRV